MSYNPCILPAPLTPVALAYAVAAKNRYHHHVLHRNRKPKNEEVF